MGKDTRSKQKSRTSAYVIAYNSSNNKALLIRKQVLSFDAIQEIQGSKFNSKIWSGVRQAIQQKRFPIKANGQMLSGSQKGSFLGKRFSGMLLPGGGKQAFPGGGVGTNSNPNEKPKEAALREFNEELGLQHSIFTVDDMVELHKINDTAIYYCVDIKDVDLDIGPLNSKIRDFERMNSSLEEINNNNSNNTESFAYLPEAHSIEWCPIGELSRRFSNIDDIFIQTQLDIFSKFICKNLDINDNDSIQSLENNLFQHIIKNEPIEWHIEAANKLENFCEKNSNNNYQYLQADPPMMKADETIFSFEDDFREGVVFAFFKDGKLLIEDRPSQRQGERKVFFTNGSIETKDHIQNQDYKEVALFRNIDEKFDHKLSVKYYNYLGDIKVNEINMHFYIYLIMDYDGDMPDHTIEDGKKFTDLKWISLKNKGYYFKYDSAFQVCDMIEQYLVINGFIEKSESDQIDSNDNSLYDTTNKPLTL